MSWCADLLMVTWKWHVGLLNLLSIENNEMFLDSMSSRRLGGEREWQFDCLVVRNQSYCTLGRVHQLLQLMNQESRYKRIWRCEVISWTHCCDCKQCTVHFLSETPPPYMGHPRCPIVQTSILIVIYQIRICWTKLIRLSLLNASNPPKLAFRLLR